MKDGKKPVFMSFHSSEGGGVFLVIFGNSAHLATTTKSTMKLVQFALKLKSGSTYSKRVGIELQNEILDLTGSLQINSAMEFIQAGPSLMEKVHR